MPTHFDLFSIPAQFTLNPAQLEQAYFSLQRQYHPDRFAGKPAQARQLALRQSMDINEAYRILKDPLKRAIYLLELQGISVGSDHDTVKPEAAMLLEVMEWREQLMDCNDATSLELLASAQDTAYREMMESMELAFTSMNFLTSAQLVLKFSYLSKLREETAQKQRILASK